MKYADIENCNITEVTKKIIENQSIKPFSDLTIKELHGDMGGEHLGLYFFGDKKGNFQYIGKSRSWNLAHRVYHHLHKQELWDCYVSLLSHIDGDPDIFSLEPVFISLLRPRTNKVYKGEHYIKKYEKYRNDKKIKDFFSLM